MGRRKLLGLALGAGAIAAGCSILAPSDDELLGGDGKDGGTATGGTAGTSDSGVGGSGGSTGGSGGNTGGSGGSTGGSGGVAASGGTAGAAGSSGGAAGTAGSAGTSGSGGSGGTTCTPGPVTATALPTAMYLMLDRTTSIAGDWSKVQNAVQEFILHPDMNGNSVALQYMPPEPGSGSCTGNGYDSPAVPMAVMPGGANAITSSLNSTNTAGSSQMQGALSGGTKYCTAQAKQDPGKQVVFVMLTDYSTIQDTCGVGSQQLLAALDGALGAEPPVRSWFLSLGALGFIVDQLANAGGTNAAVDVGSIGSIRNALLRAAVGCRYAIPAGGSIASVSVAGNTVAKVNGAKGCNNAGYYEIGSPATAVELCNSSCDQVANSAPVQLTISCP